MPLGERPRPGRFFRRGLLAAIFAATALTPASAAVTVAVTPATGTVSPSGTKQLHAAVAGSTNPAVTWMVNGIPGGAPSIGLISSSGLYTAPVEVAAAFFVEIEAQSAAAPLVAGTATVKVAASSPTTGTTFLVATTGSDANPGTAVKPWRTIQHAVASVPAGSTILVRAGTYRELVTISRSGSARAGFITLAAFPGTRPVIDGSGLGIPNDENGLVTIANASFVRVRGFELRNYVSTDVNIEPIGIYVYGGGSHIEILNNHIHNITTKETNACAINATASCGNALGILIYGNAAAPSPKAAPPPLENVIIDGNELDSLATGSSESLTLSGNVQDFQVTNNLIHNNDNIGIDAAGYEGVSAAAYDRARHGWIAGNTVHDITSKANRAYLGTDGTYSLGADGIYVDGGENVVIERNLVHHTDIGIEAASEHKGEVSSAVTIRSNIVHDSYIVGLSIGGYDSGRGGTTGCVIVNNTLFVNDSTRSGLGEFQIQYHASANEFVNNIADANVQGLLVNGFVAQTASPASLGHNLYFSPLGSANSQWVWNGVSYTGLAAYQKGSRTDAGSSFASPGFVNTGLSNFQLGSASPAKRAGVALPLSWAGRFDFAGRPRMTGTAIDQGAYQN